MTNEQAHAVIQKLIDLLSTVEDKRHISPYLDYHRQSFSVTIDGTMDSRILAQAIVLAAKEGRPE